MGPYGIVHKNDMKPGTWLREASHDDVLVFCPRCGVGQNMYNYLVSDNGLVFPTFLCVNPQCSFQRFVQLESYEDAGRND